MEKSSTKYKIALMTQPLGFNYGGVIQNYALQKVLTDLGHSCVTIKRGEENPHVKLKIFASMCKSLVLRYIFSRRAPIFLDAKRISVGNRTFIKRHIKLSPQLHSTVMLKNYFARQKFDAVVVGSDQVWRPQYSPNLYNFFLDFLQNKTNIKKLTYAASFGTDEWEFTQEQTHICNNLIQQFNAVSVREDSGKKLCAAYLNRNDGVHVLDPTCLLSADVYSRLIGKNRETIGLFTYILDEFPDKLHFVTQCAKNLNLSVHSNQAKLPPNHVDVNNLQDYIIPPIEGWLQGFRDAEFVITDSFHGTVFSIINEKPFFVLVNNDRGAARFESLLNQLGLHDRIVYDLDSFGFENLTKRIDYNSVLSKLQLLKTQSLSFLQEQLQ